MKKNFFFAAFAALAMMGTVSCSSDETFDQVSENSSVYADSAKLSLLRQNLQVYNSCEFDYGMRQL